MRTKPDDRRNNEERFQHTIENFLLAEEVIEGSEEENYKKVFKRKESYGRRDTL